MTNAIDFQNSAVTLSMGEINCDKHVPKLLLKNNFPQLMLSCQLFFPPIQGMVLNCILVMVVCFCCITTCATTTISSNASLVYYITHGFIVFKNFLQALGS